jgi:hypothetical protein
MNCTRCQGLMLEEPMIDMAGAYGEMWSISSCCVNCGHRDDAVLRHHCQASARSIVVSHQAIPQETVEVSWEAGFVESLAA